MAHTLPETERAVKRRAGRSRPSRRVWDPALTRVTGQALFRKPAAGGE